MRIALAILLLSISFYCQAVTKMIELDNIRVREFGVEINNLFTNETEYNLIVSIPSQAVNGCTAIGIGSYILYSGDFIAHNFLADRFENKTSYSSLIKISKSSHITTNLIARYECSREEQTTLGYQLGDLRDLAKILQ